MMKKRYVFLLILSFLVLNCNFNVKMLTPDSRGNTPFAAQNIPTPVATISVTAQLIPGDLGLGDIHGKITDANIGVPIAGATVTCEHNSYTSPATCSGTATTDEYGIYVFEDVFFHDTDTIKLTVVATGYQTQEITESFFTINDMEANILLSPMP